MKKIDVEIKGICPLLQNRFPEEDHGHNMSKSKKKVYEPKREAEKALYKDKEGNICHPSEHILGALIKAATDFKFEGKKTYKDIIKAGIVVEPDLIPLNKSTYDEIDTRSVVIQRARVMKWRPKFNDWKLNFKLEILDDENLNPEVLKEILERAGKTKGIGDYRPRFGRFMVTKFEENA